LNLLEWNARGAFNKSAISTTFWNTIYFYTASATAGTLSYDFARGRHCTVSAAASRRHVDAPLDLFARKSPRSLRDLAGKRALSARRLFLWMLLKNGDFHEYKGGRGEFLLIQSYDMFVSTLTQAVVRARTFAPGEKMSVFAVATILRQHPKKKDPTGLPWRFR